MNTTRPLTDLLSISVTLSATPQLFLVKSGPTIEPGKDLLSFMDSNGFDVQVDVAVPYVGLSAIADGWLWGRRFQVSEGLFGSYMVIQKVAVSGEDGGRLTVRVAFSGSFGGTLLFTGKPVINRTTKKVELSELKYHLESSSFLLNTAKWLFPGKIFKEIEPYTSLDISDYLDQALERIHEWLNRSWMPGISATGTLEDLTMSAQAGPQHLVVSIRGQGKLGVNVREEDLEIKP